MMALQITPTIILPTRKPPSMVKPFILIYLPLTKLIPLHKKYKFLVLPVWCQQQGAVLPAILNLYLILTQTHFQQQILRWVPRVVKKNLSPLPIKVPRMLRGRLSINGYGILVMAIPQPCKILLILIQTRVLLKLN